MSTRATRGQFSLRAMVLLTVASAALLSGLLTRSPLVAVAAGLLWLAMVSVAGALDYRAGWRVGALAGPLLAGALTGMTAGAAWAVMGFGAESMGSQSVLWPGSSLVYHVYWWTASGALVGVVAGAGVEWHGWQQPSPVDTPEAQAPAWCAQAPHWLASVHLHVLAFSVLSITAIGSGGRFVGDAGSPQTETVETCLTGTFLTSNEDIPETEAIRLGSGSLAAPPSPELAERVALLADPEQRAEALVWLLTRDPSATGEIKALRRTAPPAIRRDLDLALDSFTACQGGGGLRVTLVADKTVVKPGQTVNLTTVVRNTLPEPLNLTVGFSYEGVWFESGRLLRLQAPRRQLEGARRLEPGDLFCGTGAGPIHALAPSGATLTYRMATTLGRKQASLNVPGITAGQVVEAWLLGDNLCLPTAGADVHRIWVHYEVAAMPPGRPAPMWRHGKFDPNARWWAGTVASNEVVIRVAGQ